MACQPLMKSSLKNTFRREGFKKFVTYASFQEHVNSATNYRLLEIHPRLGHVLHRKVKQAMKMMLWERKDIMGKWFVIAKKKAMEDHGSVMHSRWFSKSLMFDMKSKDPKHKPCGVPLYCFSACGKS